MLDISDRGGSIPYAPRPSVSPSCHGPTRVSCPRGVFHTDMGKVRSAIDVDGRPYSGDLCAWSSYAGCQEVKMQVVKTLKASRARSE